MPAPVLFTTRAQAPEQHAVAGRSRSARVTERTGKMPPSPRYAQDKVWKRLRLNAKQTRHHSPAAAESPSHDQQTALIHGHLCVVILLKAGIRRIFHDARLWVGKVVLIPVARSWRRWGRRAATGATPGRAFPLRTLRQLGLILRLLGCRPLGSARLQHHFGLRQPRQAVLAPRDLVAHHQPIRHLWLVALFAQA